MSITIKGLIAVAACASLFSGCITHEETTVRDVERVKVEFENDTAARIFYETLSKAPAASSRTESKTEVSLPIIFDHKSRVVAGPNDKFNEAVGICDSNKDGKITELEAKIFAEQSKKR
ncbi:MAG: hypothetical protein NTW03_11795 [Verrucomicrobia bacterium]|nr:hypothetical protein [Verrucomicrobiota bacterium]